MALFFLGGCARSAVFTTFEPSEGPGLGARRVTVLDLDGPGALSAIAGTELIGKLRAIGLYELVPPPQLPSVSPASYRPGLDPRHDWARNRGVDTLVRGKIRKSYTNNTFGGGITFGDPELKVLLDLEIVDAQRGIVLATETVEQAERVDTDTDPADAGSEANVAKILARRCVQEATTKLFARERTVKAQLAAAGYGQGSSSIRRGNKLARRGEWMAARAEYRKALATNIESHAAAYNLGVTYEALHDHGAARHLYSMAARKDQREEYQEAERRAAQTIELHQLAATQRRQGVRPASGGSSPFVAAHETNEAASHAVTSFVSAPQPARPPVRRLPPVR